MGGGYRTVRNRPVSVVYFFEPDVTRLFMRPLSERVISRRLDFRAKPFTDRVPRATIAAGCVFYVYDGRIDTGSGCFIRF